MMTCKRYSLILKAVLIGKQILTEKQGFIASSFQNRKLSIAPISFRNLSNFPISQVCIFSVTSVTAAGHQITQAQAALLGEILGGFPC